MAQTLALPELLLPAGGFDSGIAAFEGGADAIYLGFRSYSARRQAKNFDFLEYRRILRLAREKGKRIYVAVNTVILGDEYPELIRLLCFLENFPPDGLIFQDWGLASLVRENFPTIPLHASTQTAIQSAEAARLAASLGVSRIVLPRECGIEDLKRFKSEAPGLEYEVFVHGALCYSFSGLCLASGLLLGRSGNRGACAQVCRSYYAREGSHEEGFWFSCRDLELVDELEALVRAGAASLKVEGRMKSPEYVHAVARLYRSALDALNAEGGERTEKAASLEELRKEAHIAFSRSPTTAYFHGPRAENLIDPAYPGHRGIPAGKVVGYRLSSALVELSEPVGLRDGLQAFPEPGEGRGSPRAEPLAFSAQGLVDAASGRELGVARPGSLAGLELPSRLPPGTLLFKISSRKLDRRIPSPEEYPPSLRILPARLSLKSEGEGARLVLDLELCPPGGKGERKNISLADEETIPLAPARTPGGFRRVIELFAESGEADFRLELSFDASARIGLASGGSLAMDDLFVPPSLLKKAKNRLYAALGERLAELDEDRARELSSQGPGPSASSPAFPAPARRELVFNYEGLPSGMPFALPGLLERGEELPQAGGRFWLPLSPLVADWPRYESLIEARVAKELGLGKSVMVGIDALHHIPLALRLCELHPEGESLSFFGDIHLYIASWRAEASLRALLPRIAFEYAYLEPVASSGKGEASSAIDAPLALPVGEGFEPPLFISRACFLKHHVVGGACPPACLRKHFERLSDRGRRYVVVVDACVTMLFRTE